MCASPQAAEQQSSGGRPGRCSGPNHAAASADEVLRMQRAVVAASRRALVESTFGDIFPPKVFLAQSNSPRLGSILKR